MRNALIAIGVVLALGFVLSLGSTPDTSTENASQPAVTQAADSQPSDTPLPAKEPITVSGRGQSIADVELTRGLARFSMKHEGSGHFAVELLTPDGQRATGANAASDTLLANTSGAPWEGQKAVRIEKAGPFVLDVSANGPWQVTITY